MGEASLQSGSRRIGGWLAANTRPSPAAGLLLRYQLPAGSGGLHSEGAGRGAANRPVTLLWGWTRHDWGQIHYWIAGLLIAILAVHLALHWKWIVCVLRGAHGDASGLRFGLGLASLVALLLIAAAPLLAPLERVTRGELQREQSAPEPVAFDRTSDLKGSMTLAEVAQASNLSVADLLELLDLPGDVAPEERIGRLLGKHRLRMNDLRQRIRSDESIAAKETEP